MNKITILALLLIIGGCSPQIRVYSDYDPQYNLGKYATFNWQQKTNIESGNNPLYYNELNDKRIKAAVQEELTSKGYVLTEEKSDLVLHYHIIIDDQSIVTTDPHGYYSPYWMNMQTNIYQYREGTLIIDLMEPKTNNLVWRGWAVSAIDAVYTPDQTDHLIKIAIGKIFRKFPRKVIASQQPIEKVVIN